MGKKARWTVLTYIAAHNNLDAFGSRSLDDILAVGSSDEVVLGVLYDGPAGAARYVAGDPGFVLHQQQLGTDFDSGDGGALIASARWLFERHPAEHYGLVLWSHGTGWAPDEVEAVANEVRAEPAVNAVEKTVRAAAPAGRCLFRGTLRRLLAPAAASERAILFDDGSGHSLDTIELGQVTAALAASIGQPLDLLGMDACLMATIEVAYELRGTVRYLVASEELVPGHSWPYRSVFGALRAHPAQGGAGFAATVVDLYAAAYAANPPAGGDVTKVAVDLGRIAELVGPVDRLARALRDDIGSSAEALWQAQRTAWWAETRQAARRPSKFDFHLWDIGSLADALAASATLPAAVREAAVAVRAALAPGSGAVLAEHHVGSWFDGIGGLSACLMLPTGPRLAPAYAELAFARDTQWDEMLAAYRAELS